MSKKLNRFLSLMLAIMMILSMLPATALAAEEEAGSTKSEESQNTPVKNNGDADATQTDLSAGESAGKNEEAGGVSDIALEEAEGTETDAVATVDGVPYFDLQSAVAAADGKTVTLLSDITFNQNTRTHNSGDYYDGLYYVGDNSFTLDLNGKTITNDSSVNDYLLNFKNNGSKASEITIKNGTLEAASSAFCAVCTTAGTQQLTVNLENVKVIGNNPNGSVVKIRGAQTVLNVNDGTVITGKDSYLGIEVSEATANVNDGAEIYMNGTTSYNGCLIGVSNGGTINVNGGYGEGAHGGLIAMTSGGTIYANGGTWIADKNNTGNEGNHSVLICQSEDAYNSTIEVTGGSYTGKYNCYSTGTGTAEIAIYGGTFSEPVPAEYCGSGMIPTQISEGVYGVKDEYVAKINRKSYATLAEAIKAAKDDDTILLIADAYVNEILTINKNITIADYDTFTVKLIGNAGFSIVDDAEVTFKNFTIDISKAAAKGDCIIGIGNYSTDGKLTLDSVNVTGNGYSSAYAVLYVYNTSELNINGGNYNLSNDQASAGGFIKAEQGKDGIVNITDAKIDLTDAKIGFLDGTVTLDGVELTVKGGANAINQSALTVIDSTVTVDGADGRALTLSQGDVTIQNSTLNLSNCSEGEIRFKKGLTLHVDEDSTIAECDIWSDVSTGAKVNDTEVTGTEKNPASITNATVTNPDWAVKVGDAYFMTLTEAFKNVENGQTIELMPGATINNETVKMPAALSNVTVKGAEGAVLKDSTIMSADGNSIAYDGLTFDGLTFDNSRIVITGWRTNGVDVKDLTVTNCVFKNLNDTTSQAPVHINMDATEAVENFTFTDNVIDGAIGGSKSGVYAQTTGKTVFTGNTINNVAFRPYLIQVTTDDGIADELIVTGNTFSGSAAGRAQGLGNNAAGTDTVKLVVSENIFKDITSAQQICYWNFNPETTTADLSRNYYDIDVIAKPDRIYYNSAASSTVTLAEMGVFPIYTALNEDGTIDTASAYTPAYGTITPAYTSATRIWGEAEGNANESLVIKLFCGDTLIATTSLNNIDGIIDGDVFVTWGVNTDGTTDEYWTTTWTEGHPNINSLPDKVVLYVDGEEVASNNCQLNAPDDLNKIVAAVCDENGKTHSFATSLAEAVAAAKSGDTIILMEDVELDAPITVKTSVIIDGNGHKITQSESCNNNIALLYFEGEDGAPIDVTVENVTFDGLKTGAAIRTLNADITIDNVVFQNCEHTVGQGLVRLTKGTAVVKNSKFQNNNCSMGISFNWDTAGNAEDTLLVENCVFDGNTATKTALIYYVKGAGCTLNNNQFIGNTVDTKDNCAVVYLGFQDNCTVTGNLFKGNTVKDASTSTRVAGSVFAGYQATITGNAFDGNTATNASGDQLGQVCISTYYEDGKIDLSNNYWGGNAPVPGVDYFVQHQTGTADFTMNSYYTAYEIDEEGKLSLNGETATNYVAQIGKYFYSTIDAALAAAKAGDTVTVFAGTYEQDLSVKKDITVVGEGEVNFNGKLSITADGVTVKGMNFNSSGNAGYISAKDVLVEDCTVVGSNGFRYCYTSGTVTFKDSTITGNTYGIHFDGNAGGNIVIDNCAITGWTSFAGTISEVSIKDTEFLDGKYDQLRFYQNATLENVVFNPEMTVDFGKKGVSADFTDCSVSDGSDLLDVIYLPDLAEMDVNVTVDGEPVVVVALIGKTAYLSIDEALDAVKSGETITLYADCTLTEEHTFNSFELNIAGEKTLTVNDASNKNLLKVGGDSKLNITAPVTGEVWLKDGAKITDSTVNGNVFVAGNVTFSGDNTVAMLYDFGELKDYYGAEANMKWSIEKGGSLTLTSKSRYGLGYGDNITITGELAEGDALTIRETLTEEDLALFMHGISLSSGNWSNKSYLTVENAYVTIGSNNSLGTTTAKGGDFFLTFKNSVLTTSRLTNNATGSNVHFVAEGSDLQFGSAWSNLAPGSTTKLTNSKLAVTGVNTNGTDVYNCEAGTMELVNTDLTFGDDFTINGTIYMDANSTITAPAITGTGKIVIDATGFTGDDVLLIAADMSGFTGTVEVKGAVYEITENGLVIIAAEAAIGDTCYKTVEEALAAAKNGDTVSLLADWDAGNVVVLAPGRTLDLNGFKLTAEGVATFKGSHVIDSSENTTGVLFVPRDCLALQTDNKELPLWNEKDGYVFVTPNTSAANKYQYFEAVTDNSFKLAFRPGFGTVNGDSVRSTYLATDGGENNGLTMAIRLSWTNESGQTVHHDVEFTDEMFKNAYQSGQAFKVTVTGTGAFGEITVNAVIMSDTGAEFVGEDIVYTSDVANNA